MIPPQTPAVSAQQGQVNTQQGQLPQPNQDAGRQPLTPPQPPQGAGANGQITTGSAQLGVFVVPTDGAGVRISSVTPGTAADAAGLEPGDVILSLNGKLVRSPQDVIAAVRQSRVGDQVELRVWRDGNESTIVAALQEMQATSASVEYGAPSSGYGYIEGYGGSSDVYGSVPLVQRYYGYYPGSYNYPYNGYYGRSYRWGYPAGAYYGTPGFGYYRSPWGQGVRIGSFGFGWR